MAPKDDFIAWLRDAHAMEMQALQMLEGQERRIEHYPELRSRIRQHIDETRRQADLLEGCIERQGETTSGLKDAAAQFVGAMQAMSGLVMSDEIVKGAIASYTFEHYEIACYRTLIAAADEVGDAETKRVCEQILREEEAMADWLAAQLPQVTSQYLRRSATDQPAKR
jgi:ferritin-like metal-binding protein YciE